MSVADILEENLESIRRMRRKIILKNNCDWILAMILSLLLMLTVRRIAASRRKSPPIYSQTKNKIKNSLYLLVCILCCVCPMILVCNTVLLQWIHIPNLLIIIIFRVRSGLGGQKQMGRR